MLRILLVNDTEKPIGELRDALLAAGNGVALHRRRLLTTQKNVTPAAAHYRAAGNANSATTGK